MWKEEDLQFQSLRAGACDEWKADWETKFVFYPPLKIYYLSKKGCFGRFPISFLDASLKTMFKIQSLRDVFKISKLQSFTEY